AHTRRAGRSRLRRMSEVGRCWPASVSRIRGEDADRGIALRTDGQGVSLADRGAAGDPAAARLADAGYPPRHDTGYRDVGACLDRHDDPAADHIAMAV